MDSKNRSLRHTTTRPLSILVEHMSKKYVQIYHGKIAAKYNGEDRNLVFANGPRQDTHLFKREKHCMTRV